MLEERQENGWFYSKDGGCAEEKAGKGENKRLLSSWRYTPTHQILEAVPIMLPGD